LDIDPENGFNIITNINNIANNNADDEQISNIIKISLSQIPDARVARR
jgi:hypothetical protein